MTRPGYGTRYDADFGGNHIQKLRDQSPSAGVFLPYHKRFCETCQRHMPKDGTKAVKGWKCEECRGKK